MRPDVTAARIEASLIDSEKKNRSSLTLLSFSPRRDIDAGRRRSRAASHDFIDHTNRKSQECRIPAYDFLTRNAAYVARVLSSTRRHRPGIQNVRGKKQRDYESRVR